MGTSTTTRPRWLPPGMLGLIVVALAVGGRISWNAHRIRLPEEEKPPARLKSLSEPFFNRRYRVDPYIRAAAEIQAMPGSGAAELLLAMGRTDNDRARVIVLCRMLFIARPNGEFRPPHLGAPAFLGGTSSAD